MRLYRIPARNRSPFDPHPFIEKLGRGLAIASTLAEVTFKIRKGGKSLVR